MKLQRLTGLEREKIENEYNDLLVKIADLEDILAKESRVFAIIKEEQLEIKDKILLNEGSIAGIKEIPKHIQDKYKTVWDLSM